MKITRMELKRFRNNFKVAVKDLEKDFGVTIDLGSIKFSNSEFSGKLNVLNVGENKENLDSEQLKFEAYCSQFGFKKSDYKCKVSLSRSSYTLIGFKPSNRKYPCIVEGPQGGKYKVTVNQVKDNLL